MQNLFGILYFLAILVSVTQGQKKEVDYCQLKCTLTQKEHFICTLKHQCGKGPSCVNFVGDEYTTHLKQITLDWHNYYRNYVALGKETRGNQPKASNMKELVWDNELEYIAQCHANQCKFEHDPCRRSSSYGENELPPGQNIAAMADSSKNNEEKIKGMVKNWYEEVALMDASYVDKFPQGSSAIGHYTQMVWAETSHLGCGFVIRESGGFKEYALLVCNYGVGGNLLGAKIYNRGDPCKDCSKCHPEFKGLCTTEPSTSSYPDISKYAPEGYTQNDIIKYGPPKASTTENVPSSSKALIYRRNTFHLLLVLPLMVAFVYLRDGLNTMI